MHSGSKGISYFGTNKNVGKECNIVPDRSNSRVCTLREMLGRMVAKENREALVDDCLGINKSIFYYVNFNSFFSVFRPADIKIRF